MRGRGLLAAMLMAAALPCARGARGEPGCGLPDMAEELDHLARRLALTAHADEDPERLAIAALERMAEEARAAARNPSTGDAVLTPSEAAIRLRAASAEVDRALDAAGPYETLRAEWEHLREQCLAPTFEALAAAQPAVT